MQFLIVALALVAAVSAQHGSEKVAAIVRQASDISPDGSYAFNYETENGIAASESGAPKAVGPEGPAVVAQGQFQYPSPEGGVISLQYTADENGFQPQGAHLPVAPVGPEIPELIKKALAWIAAHPSQEQKPGKPY